MGTKAKRKGIHGSHISSEGQAGERPRATAPPCRLAYDKRIAEPLSIVLDMFGYPRLCSCRQRAEREQRSSIVNQNVWLRISLLRVHLISFLRVDRRISLAGTTVAFRSVGEHRRLDGLLWMLDEFY
jgi:hypothetical protein